MGTILVDNPTYTCQKAIMLYGSGQSESGIAMIHDVDTNKSGQAIIGEGHLAATPEIADLLRDLLGQSNQLRYVPNNVLALDRDAVVWYVPPSKRSLYFSLTSGEKFSGECWQPGLIFAVMKRSWFVYAVTTDRERPRPTPETVLYHAPYMNVWGPGQICVGNVTLPRSRNFNEGLLSAWEDAFFHSWFTHLNDQNQRRIQKGDFVPFWKRRLGSKSRFPDGQLVPTKMTLADVLSRKIPR